MKIIALIGFRAAGKTTIGKFLAKKLGWEFFDLDQELQLVLGESLPSYVEAQGIPAFRQAESEMISQIFQRARQQQRNCVIAFGGGFVDSAESVRLLQEWRAKLEKDLLVVHLDTPLEIIWQRLISENAEARIGKVDTFEELEKLSADREPKFQDLSDIQVAAAGEVSEIILQKVIKKCESINPEIGFRYS